METENLAWKLPPLLKQETWWLKPKRWQEGEKSRFGVEPTEFTDGFDVRGKVRGCS